MRQCEGAMDKEAYKLQRLSRKAKYSHQSYIEKHLEEDPQVDQCQYQSQEQLYYLPYCLGKKMR